MPGSVWESGEPRWVEDASAEPSFPRLGVASSEGLRSGFGLPIGLDGAVVAVMEFLSREARPLDPDALDVAESLGIQICQFVERKRTEEELRRAEEKYRGIFENSVEGIFQSTVEGRMVTANPAMARILGYEWPAELIASIHDVREQLYVDPGSREELARLLRQQDAVSGFEVQVYRKDGVPIWTSSNIRAIRGPDGEIAGYEGTVEDVTERKRAQEGLEESNRRATNILESITDAFYALDHEWRFTYVNPQAEPLLRKKREELLGRSVWEVYPEAVGRNVYHKYHQAMAEQVTLSFEEYYPPLETWFELHIYPSRDGLSVYFRDITERKRAEEALQARARQQAAVAELGRRALEMADLGRVMGEAVSLVARVLDVEYCKVLELLPGGEQLRLVAGVGWREGLVGEATVGTGLHSQAGYTLASDSPVIVRDLATETRFSGPPLLHEHGVVSGLSAVIGGQEGPYGVLGAHTRERRVFTPDDANFLQAVANVLATAIRRKGYEERLASERGEAERLAELDRLRRDFVSSVSHELRTPLTAILSGLGFFEACMAGRVDEAEGRLLGNARRNAERLGRLIDDLLAYNQLEAGTLELEHRSLDLRDVVADTVSVVQPLVQEKGQEISVDLPEPLLVEGDAYRLGQVLINLFSNAHRHTPAGTGIEVSGRREGCRVLLTVADTGPGIPPEHLGTIFERFRSLDPAAKGSGLGLAISRGIVELHGGRIWAENLPGGGGAFRVELPAAGCHRG